MVKDKQTSVKQSKEIAQSSGPPKSLAIAEEGIETSRDFARFMSCLMSDIMTARITPQVANAAVNAGGKLLKVVEMQHRYGQTGIGNAKTLKLASA